MRGNPFTVSCTGLKKGAPPDPCTVIIFGASGDLARRELLPSLYALYEEQLLPDPCTIIGLARTEWNDETFRTAMHDAVKDAPRFHPDRWRQFAKSLYYHRADYGDQESHVALHQRIHRTLPGDDRLLANMLFHLAVPPSVYSLIIERLGAGPLTHDNHGWRRVIIEKPFGHDEASAEALDRQLQDVFREEQIYRIDHYLGKETVQNMLVFRFANPGFEPIWNRNYIDHVQITVAENLGIGSRGRFYDATGVVRDMVQNHLLHLLCLTAMEPPAQYTAASLRAETRKVLDAVASINVDTDCIVGQYGPGRIAEERVCAYREEEHVAAESITPTFVALKLLVNNWRWVGVPFYLRTGKRMARKVAEVTVCFKPTPHSMFPLDQEVDALSNTLTFRLQPEEGILQTFLAKQPGAEICLRPVTMHFDYDSAFGVEHPPSAYQWLLLDALRGDQTLFPNAKWIAKAWSLVDPVVAAAGSQGAAAFPNYAAGSWGPQEAERLLQRDGRQWVML